MGLFDFFSSSPAGSSSSSSSSSSSPPPIPNSLPSPPALQPSAPEVSSKHITALNPQGIKPCCACPDTKIPRDDCFLRYGHEGLEKGSESEGEGWRCRELVEEHRRCMAKLGFKI